MTLHRKRLSSPAAASDSHNAGGRRGSCSPASNCPLDLVRFERSASRMLRSREPGDAAFAAALPHLTSYDVMVGDTTLTNRHRAGALC